MSDADQEYEDDCEEQNDEDQNEEKINGSSESLNQTDEMANVKNQTAEEFDSQHFLCTLDKFCEKLQKEEMQSLDVDYPYQDLKEMVTTINVSMVNFRTYSERSGGQMERMRGMMGEITTKINKKLQQTSYASQEDNAHESYETEERELAVNIARLNEQLAKAAEEMTIAAHTSIETETALVKAQAAASKASQQADSMQTEYDKRAETTLQSSKLEEERKLEEKRLLEEEERKKNEELREEEERQSRLRKEEVITPPVWEDWTCHEYTLAEPGDFDHGLCCIVRVNDDDFNKEQLVCYKTSQLESQFVYGESDELVSNIFVVDKPTSETDNTPPDEQDDELPESHEPVVEKELDDLILQHELYIAVPHCMTRVSGISREPVIKLNINGKWIELETQDVIFENYKDTKFVQAKLTHYGTVSVVTRYKKDFLVLPKTKRGSGKVISNFDQRLTFSASKNTFKENEHFVLQVHPLDISIINDVRNRDGCQGLLTASSVIGIEWTSSEFEQPVKMTLPCPANPAKAKKAAAVKAVKEAKMNNSQHHDDDDGGASGRRNRSHPVHTASKWYMGQYAVDDDDESERFYLLRPNSKGAWVVEKNVEISTIRLDLLQIEMVRPINRFIVLRVRTSVDSQDVRLMTETIMSQVAKRSAHAVVKQRDSNMNDILVQVVAVSRLDRTMRTLDDEGEFIQGPGHSSLFYLHEGDTLEVSFRGNICPEEKDAKLTMLYNSQLTTRLDFSIKEVNEFLQRNYPVYRGVIQVNRVRRTIKVKETRDGETDEDEEVITRSVVAELVVGIPKNETSQDTRQSPRVPVTIRCEGPVTEDCLRSLADSLGEEWNTLARCLGVSPIRLSAILRTNQTGKQSEKGAKFDMLMTWRKKVPRSVDTVQVLRHALKRCGRSDLASKLEILGLSTSSHEQEAN